MREGPRVVKKIFGPYSIISLITIWSFLLFSISTDACLDSPLRSISPPLNSHPIVSTVYSDKGIAVSDNGKAAEEQNRKEFSYLYINLLIAKALQNNYDISAIREELKKYYAWQLHVEKIPKSKGLYVTYQKTSEYRASILHYFLDEKDSYASKYITLPVGPHSYLHIESISSELYAQLANDIKVLFSPEGGCEDELLDAINASRCTIDAAICDFSSIKIAEAIKKAASRGVKVRLFLNGKRDSNKLAGELESYDVKIKYYYKKGSLMHNKFMIIDDKKIYTGSYNWTGQAEKLNRENLIILPFIESFKEEFCCLWGCKDRSPPKIRGPSLCRGIMSLFSPRGRCEDELIRLISEARANKECRPEIPYTIKIALHYFTNKKIAKELFDAKESGVNIEIVLDKIQQNHPASAVRHLHRFEDDMRNIDPGRMAKKNRGYMVIKYYRIKGGMMHNKFAIIGNNTVTGSYNWTKAAENKNMENLILIPFKVGEYYDEFESLWREGYDEDRIDDSSCSSARSPPPRKEIHTVAELYRGEIIGKELEELNKYKKDFAEKEQGLLIAKEDFVLYRVSDSWTIYEGAGKAVFTYGRWFAEEKDVDFSPSRIKKNLNLLYWNDAQYKGVVIIKKGTVFLYGKVKGGDGNQIFVNDSYIKKGFVLYITETMQWWDRRCRAWRYFTALKNPSRYPNHDI
ncbi:MAG: phospholipase D-like domain-containing protein [Candidatus Omnitrophota bacterium]|nr:phospholipase D-like domain-containing protein [Candidatus Omnitrophota bacterium]